jgi:hypothetical protein
LQFVVDGNWVTDHTAPQENDASGNLNNVLTTDRIAKHAPAKSGVMAAAGASDVPGTFPETPAVEKDAFSVNPLPATDGAVNPIKLAPGEEVPHPSTFTSETVTSGVRDDPELVAADQAKAADQTKDESESAFGVAPLPAFAGAVNPVTVAPGEALPHPTTVTENTLGSAVTTDKEAYENSGPLGNAPVLPPVVTPQGERDLKGTGILDLPPLSNTLIPESSLPIGATGAGAQDVVPTIQSAGPQTTTAQLAGAVPLESSKVPKVVKESQEKAGFSPEASAVPEEVVEKGDVEKELLSEVPEAPSTSEGTGGKETADKSEKGISAGEAAAAVGGAAVAIGGAAVALASGAAEKLPESVTSNLPESVTSKLPESVQHSISDINAKSNTGTAADADVADTTAKDTPEVVKESIAESGETPEAAANEEAVLEKKAVEQELLSEVKPETSTGEPAPTTTTSTTASALAAPAAPAAPAAASDVAGSRDISPGTVPGDHTGVAAATTETTTAAPSTPAKSTTTTGTGSPAGSATAAAEKKKKRSSIFGKLKAKFSDKK